MSSRPKSIPSKTTSARPAFASTTTIMVVSASTLALLAILYSHKSRVQPVKAWTAADVPTQAQVVDPRSFAVLDYVPPPSQANATTLFIPPGTTLEALLEKPFHIYDDDFYEIIGTNPTLTLLADSTPNPLYHEAVVWYPPTDEVFFVQNAGAKAAGTGLAKSAVISKISLSQAANAASSGSKNATGIVDVVQVDSTPMVINPNGATNYKGDIVFMGEGQGDDITSSIFLMNPVAPYNTTVILNNINGRQFNSLNDVAVSPINKELYFTDTVYGYVQDFRPRPGFPNQVYRFNPDTGVVRVAADGMDKPNGITFSPDGRTAYITDTGAGLGFYGYNFTAPATVYSFQVKNDGTWHDKQTFAYIAAGIPDGIHCDDKGNVYVGCGDGVHVFNTSGKLLGKIYLGTTTANFQFAGSGRMVICAETQLYYATLAATGADITGYDYSRTG